MPRRRPDPAAGPLSDADRAFVDAYLLDPNATKAYRAVHPGVTYSTARSQGHRLMTRPDIAAEIRAGRRAQRHHAGIHARRVVAELARIAFADVIDLVDADGNLLPLSKVPPGCRAAIRSVTVKRVSCRPVGTGTGRRTVTTDLIVIRLHDKLAALTRLARYLGIALDPDPVTALLNLFPPDLAARVRGELRVPPVPSRN